MFDAPLRYERVHAGSARPGARDTKGPMPASPRLAFVLNFDAEHELEAGARWTAPKTLKAKLDSVAHEMTLPEGAVVVTPEMKLPEGTEARVWCPTPRALATVARAGLVVPEMPSVEVVRQVNERGFAAQLAKGELEPTFFSQSIEALQAFIAQPGPTGRWRLKRGLGASGRGQRRVNAGALSEEELSWMRRAVIFAPLYVEPELVIEREVAVYGWARRDRGVELTGVRGQTTDSRGAFLRCGRIEADTLGEHKKPMMEAAEKVGVALLQVGYHGPFGIDGYMHRTPQGALQLRALSEINARYCMGWDEKDGF